MAGPVSSNAVRVIAILGTCLCTAGVTRSAQRCIELAFDHLLDEPAHAIAQTGFDRNKPIIEKTDRRRGFQLLARRIRAINRHGVVSTGAPTPASFGLRSPGDYATFNSNQTPDGTTPPAYPGLSKTEFSPL
jgi:hypothetical protein